jgi:hypothetical protein
MVVEMSKTLENVCPGLSEADSFCLSTISIDYSTELHGPGDITGSGQ